MALVRGTGNKDYRRFTWMGADKTESSFENTILLRDGGDNNGGSNTGCKRRTREQRTRVIREVRCYLDHLRKEILQNDRDAELTGMPKSGYRREETEDQESEKASMNLSCLVRGARYRSGEGFASPYDGTSHGSVATLNEYNEHCHKTLSALMEERRATLGAKKEKGAHLTQREALLLEEANTIMLPTLEEAALSPEDLDVLSKPEGEATEDKGAICEKYTENALVSAKNLLQYNLVRNAKLYATYREISLSTSASRVFSPTPPNEEADAAGDSKEEKADSEPAVKEDKGEAKEEDSMTATTAGGGESKEEEQKQAE